MDDEITISIDAIGLWAWVAKNPESVRTTQIRAMVRVAHRNTWRAWADAPNGVNYGLRMRFTERAFGILNLSPRTAKYRDRQRLSLGKVLPYVSPMGGMARSTHMYKQVTQEGSGWNPRSRGLNEIHTSIKIPGARILNRMNGVREKYRTEFYDVKRNPMDVLFLTETANKNVTQGMLGLIHKMRSERLRMVG